MSAFHDNALLGASGQQGYKISRSVRLRSSASAYFNRTPASTGNQKTWTWSGWVKLGAIGQWEGIFNAGSSGNQFAMYLYTDNYLYVQDYNGSNQLLLQTSQVFRDPSAWYHIVIAIDTTQATSTNRAKLYINGSQVTALATATYPSQNYNTQVNSTSYQHNIGLNYQFGSSNAKYFDGYMTEINFVDGQQLTPSSFGETNSVTGVWQPKAYTGTYGTNGFELTFADNSNNTAATIGKDYSGNGNNWTPNNISVTAGVTYDSMVDSPTVSAASSNYCVMNPTIAASTGVGTITNGNLQCVTPTSGASNNYGTVGMMSGKWYWEITPTSISTNNSIVMIGINNNTQSATEFYSQSGGYAYRGSGEKWNNGSSSSYGSALSVNDVIGVAFDADARTLEFYRNGTSMGTAYSSIPAGDFFPAICDTGTTVTWTAVANFGQRPFSYTPPTGFVALNTQNLPTPTISNGANYMAATLYTGNGYPTSGTQTITNTVNGISLQPDFVWIKRRDAAASHTLTDSVRGVNSQLFSNQTAAQETNTDAVTALNSNGFSLGTGTSGTYPSVNSNGGTYVGWQWKANGTAVTNTSGSITSTVSAGATQGFSVATFTTPSSFTNATVGHGLGVAPKMIIVKRRTTGDWITWHTSLGTNGYVTLNTTSASSSNSGSFNGTSSTTWTLGSNAWWQASASDWVAYCFAEVAGYSKFGSYTGNGSSDGPFVYTGFRPRFVMYKRTDTTADWIIQDSSRNTYNLVNNLLYPNSSSAEVAASGAVTDFLSNGFKLRGTSPDINGGTVIYAAFAENPFKISLAR
jgi:hypothetical protein